MSFDKTLAILGAGNIGTSIARGLVQSGQFEAAKILLTRRKRHLLKEYGNNGFSIPKDNIDAVRQARVLIVAVEPQQLDQLLQEIRPHLKAGHHILVSVVSGVSIRQITTQIPKGISVIRSTPNTAIAIQKSMTCIASGDGQAEAIDTARTIFNTVGQTLLIDEEQMTAATALGACGIAFFLRAIRAASQGGIEIGLHSEEAILIAAQTAQGAAELLLNSDSHPESEIDRVTTPRGCTIAGLNQMEHGGFSSAMIKGIITSANKAETLYCGKK